MKGIRMGAALLAAAAVGSGAASAYAGAGPTGGPPGAGTFVVAGTLSNYVKATKKAPGSVTISIAASSIPGTFVGMTTTFTLTTSVKIHKHGAIRDGDHGSVVLQSGDAILRPSLSAPVVAVYDLD
jgi:hypothetical protein